MAILEKINTKIIIIAVLIFLIIVLVLIKILTPKKEEVPLPSPSPSIGHFVLPSSKPSGTEKGQKGDPAFYEEIDKKLEQRFPLYPYLPYETEEFSIKYLGPLKLEIKVATESAQAEALNWIRSHGVDPTTHQIIFK